MKTMFITLEGIDGSGKSAQAAHVVSLLSSQGNDVIWTREPGDWAQGGAVRSILLDGNLEHPMTEALLFLADRCEHARQRIAPALAAGKMVVCERYNDSTLAYQCWGRGIDRAKLESMIEWCCLPRPDLTFWLDVPPAVAMERRCARGAADRIESEKLSFHENVAKGFKILHGEDPMRICRIDATPSAEEVKGAIRAELVARGLVRADDA